MTLKRKRWFWFSVLTNKASTPSLPFSLPDSEHLDFLQDLDYYVLGDKCSSLDPKKDFQQ